MEEFDEARSGFGTESPATLMPVKLAAVEFTYDGDQLVLKGLDVALNRGDLIGVVGPSGAGKSTLVELLLRLREPTGGSLTSGGVATHEIAPEQFARKVAFVPQHPTLITGTVADNVSFFRDVPEERIRAALELAHLADEIDTLPDGIHTKLGADDRALSGGQRQRLTIARALAGDPEIIVLDEPTSALDAISEEAIRRALDELRNDRVVIVVAHRYSTLRSCSRILVLRDGHIEIDAGPDEVAKQSDFFQAMVGDDAG
jgi:ABC-type multidrug transport system fused ATPase/permease subunit